MGTYANFYNSDNGDRVYDADSFSEWLRPFFKTGVFNGELQVLASSGMEVIVDTGNAFIEGKLKKFDSQTTLTVEQASANSTRIDSVICRRNDTDRDFTLMIVKGTTVAPLPVRENGIYDIVLAHITVPASTVEIKQENITDTRMNADICGWVVSNVEEVDFSQVTAQWADYIANFEADELQAFNEWFDTIKGQLSTDQAGSLQLQIDEQANKIAANTANISANKADIDANSADITSLQQTTSKNTSDIQAIKARDDEQDANIARNTSNIAKNASNIAINTNDITRLNKFSIVTLGTSWTQDITNGYYTQSVALSGITSNDNPIIDIVLSNTLEEMESQQEEWSKILKVETSDDGLTFYASEVTTNALNLILKMSAVTKSDTEDIQTELTDIRVGYDGTTYDSAGNAVRTQVTTLNTKINDATSELSEKADKVEVSELKSDIDDLSSSKITKFYASNQGETHIADSDNGKIQDMMIYGKSSQDGTPTLDNPIEIQSVVNPKLEVCGKNLLPTTMFSNSMTTNGVSFTNNGDGSITVSGTAKMASYFTLWGWNVLGDKGILPNLKIGDTIFSGDCIVQQTNSEKVISVTEGATTVSFETTTMYVGIRVLNGATINKTYYPYIVLGSTATDYEPYKEQTATLPYTLNAIPVTSGGNVTIDGQQYIADYVDIENKKLVRMTKKSVFNGIENWELINSNNATYCFKQSNPLENSLLDNYSKNYLSNRTLSNTTTANSDTIGSYIFQSTFIIRVPSAIAKDVNGFKSWLTNNNITVLYPIATPTIINLTDEEVQAFKSLTTYYPTTNIIVNSEQLDGYTTFNYPISMQNGWNYVKQQLNDNRDYIYDMDTQSAEAYVNSEYAVALTELEV